MADSTVKRITVIGGGPAGYIAALEAARRGAEVVLVEKRDLGGTCLNRGCIPSKAYLKNAEIIAGIKKAGERGIDIADSSLSVDMVRARDMKNKVVGKLVGGVAGLLKAAGVKVKNAEGRLQKDGSVLLDGRERLESDAVILAGGSRTVRIPVPGADLPGVMTSDEMLDLDTVPDRLLVVGGGVIGLEMAQVFHAFGSAVTIVEAESRILPFMDGEISTVMHSVLTDAGITVHTGISLQEIREASGGLEAILAGGDTVPCDAVLLSVGRGTDISSLGDAPVTTKKGRVTINEQMETFMSGVFAAGDITGQKMLAHAAFRMGEVAAANAMGERERLNLSCVPGIVYTHPEVGTVGASAEELDKRGEPYETGYFSLAYNGRALASGEEVGFVKVFSGPKYGEILGVHIVAAGASELINEAAALMAMEVTVDEIPGIIHGHPTVSEAFMEAAADARGRSLHLPMKSR